MKVRLAGVRKMCSLLGTENVTLVVVVFQVRLSVEAPGVKLLEEGA